MNKKKIITELVFYAILAVIVGIEFAYRDPLYNASIPAIHYLQDGATNFGKAIFVALSFIGAGPLYFVVFLIIFNWGGRPRAFYYLTLLVGNLWLMNLTKIAYHNPRPYMTDDKIEPIGCSHEYGNPSGHSLFAAGFFFSMFLDIFHAKNQERKKNKLVYGLSLFGTIAITVLIGFARLYVGVHSID
jgi:membrane-associated phospholipid phosphatase